MTERELAAFGKKILTEAALIAEVFDGTIGDGAFRNRVATTYYAVGLFVQLTGMRPKEYIELMKDKD